MNSPKIALIGGSGLEQAIAGETNSRRHVVRTPFGPPSDAIVETQWDGLPLLFLSRHGEGHVLGPTQVPSRANIFALKQLGCTHIIASGAVGSLRDEYRPRDLVIVDQVIDKTSKRPSTFFENAAVHVDFAEPFCPVLRRALIEAGSEAAAAESTPDGSARAGDVQRPFRVHSRGCYVCMEGPAFSTRAESLMHRLWGGDLIGMTAMPEAKLAREAEISYALVALVTDYDCWRVAPGPRPGQPPAEPRGAAELLKEIVANLRAASDNAVSLIRAAVKRIAADPRELLGCPARDALKLAIWSDKSRISRDEVERLAPLWMQYFEQ